MRIFVPVAIRALMERLRPALETAASAPVQPLVVLNPVIPQRILAGEAFDIGLTNPQYVAALIAAGRVDGASHRPFGRVPLAVARREGIDRPICRDADGIRALLGAADSIAYTGAGTSGRTYLDLLGRLGLSDDLSGKSRPMGGGEPVAAVAAGKIALAIAPLTTVLASPGVEPAAVFPDALGTHIDMSIFTASDPCQGASAVVALLTGSALEEELSGAGLTRFAFD